jgi:membrane fusion protein (multidrug efflux system)
MALFKKKFVIPSVGIILVLIFIVFKIRQSSDSENKRPVPRPSVVISAPDIIEMQRSLILTGDILPIQQANIYSRVSGNIDKIFVDIGDWVKQSRVLAVIDSTIYSQNLRQADASYLQAEANFNNAKLNFDRNTSLLDQNLISKQDLDNSKTSYQIATAQKEAAHANLNNTRTLLNYCRITAPFTGVITRRFLDAGAYVTSSTSSSSAVLFTLMDINIVKVIINVPEKNINDLNSVKDVIVEIDALRGKKFNASIKKISQALDMSTRTMAVEVDITNQSHILKPGMFATVILVLEKKPNTMAVPLQAVLQDEKGDYVFKVGRDTVARENYIKTGISNENYVEVTDGLTGEDKIIVVGQSLVKDNMKVRIVR